MQEQEFNALINLLDDKDRSVYGVVMDKLTENADDRLYDLIEIKRKTQDSLVKRRLAIIIRGINTKSTVNNFRKWLKNPKDISVAMHLLAAYRYPGLKYELIEKKLDRIAKKIEESLNSYMTPLQRIRTFNHVFYKQLKYAGDYTDISQPELSFINIMLKKKRGNAVSTSLLYLILAQKLNLNILPVDFPKNMLLAYLHNPEDKETVGFYINPFNEGIIITRGDIEKFLKKNKIDPLKQYFAPCSNKKAMMRLLDFLIFSYEFNGKNKSVESFVNLKKLVFKRKRK